MIWQNFNSSIPTGRASVLFLRIIHEPLYPTSSILKNHTIYVKQFFNEWKKNQSKINLFIPKTSLLAKFYTTQKGFDSYFQQILVLPKTKRGWHFLKSHFSNRCFRVLQSSFFFLFHENFPVLNSSANFISNYFLILSVTLIFQKMNTLLSKRK